MTSAAPERNYIRGGGYSAWGDLSCLLLQDSLGKQSARTGVPEQAEKGNRKQGENKQPRRRRQGEGM